jgi:hypothetical protein
MARQQTKKDGELITVLGDQDHDFELPPVDDAANAVLVADATTEQVEGAPAPDEVPVVKKYVVIKGGQILHNGFRTRLAEGKVIDGLNYNIAHLQKQGIRLQREETFTNELVD